MAEGELIKLRRFDNQPTFPPVTLQRRASQETHSGRFVCCRAAYSNEKALKMHYSTLRLFDG